MFGDSRFEKGQRQPKKTQTRKGRGARKKRRTISLGATGVDRIFGNKKTSMHDRLTGTEDAISAPYQNYFFTLA